MHLGETRGPGADRPLLILADGRPDGAVSANGRIAGAYVHGLFDQAQARQALLDPFGVRSNGHDRTDEIEVDLDALAAGLGRALDIDAIARIAGL